MNHDKLFIRKFNMGEGHHKNMTIWRCYHDEKQIQWFNMREDGNVFLFNSKNDGYYGRNLNYLNQFFCEAVCFLYPYLNNLQSDIIGFQHYRRVFNHHNLMLDDIKKGSIQHFFEQYDMFCTLEYRIYYHCDMWKVMDCGMYDDMIEFFSEFYPSFLNQPPRENGMKSFHICALTWENYLEMAKFIYRYIKFLDNKYKLRFSEDAWARHIEEKFINYNRNHKIPANLMKWNDLWGKNNWETLPYWTGESFKYTMYRIYSFHLEFLASCWMNYHDAVYDENNVIQFL